MVRQTSKPKTAEEWQEFWAKDSELSKKISTFKTGIEEMDDMEFKNSLASLSKEQMETLMKEMRSTLTFYKKILTEPYYTEHPEKKEYSRYKDAKTKYESINRKGKIIYSLIANFNH